jgi:hypothetical protein
MSMYKFTHVIILIWWGIYYVDIQTDAFHLIFCPYCIYLCLITVYVLLLLRMMDLLPMETEIRFCLMAWQILR